MLPSGIVIKVSQIEVGGEYPVVDFLATLITEPASFASMIDGMRRLSDPRWWGPPNTEKLKGKPYKGIFELRIKSSNRYMRVSFILTKDQKLVLMYGETKKKRTPSTKFLEQSRNYRDKINREEAHYEEIDFTQFED